MEKLELEDFYQYQYLSDVQYAPDGKKAAFIVKNANLDDNGYDSSLWLWDDTGVRRLTSQGRVQQYLWEDDNHIVFSATGRGDTVPKYHTATFFYRISVSGGEAEKCRELPLKIMELNRFAQDVYLIKARTDCRWPDYHLADRVEKERI